MPIGGFRRYAELPDPPRERRVAGARSRFIGYGMHRHHGIHHQLSAANCDNAPGADRSANPRNTVCRQRFSLPARAVSVREENDLNVNWDPREYYKAPDVASSYDRTRFSSPAGRIFNRLERRALLRCLRGLPAGAEICDVPCGTGRLAEVLLEAGYRVTGLDISQAMLDEAQRKLGRFGARFKCRTADATRLQRPEQPFAAVICMRVLMHLPLPQQIEFLRSVSSQTDGPIIFNQSYDSGYQRARRNLKRMLGHQPPARFPITEGDLGQLLRQSGLREARRFWTARGISEGVFLVTEKQ
jgi:SAM-dependent methyltransferase